MKIGEYTYREPAESLLRKLEHANFEDDAAERTKKRFGIGAVACGLGGFLGLFVAAGTGFWPLPVLLFAGLVVCIVVLVRTSRHDLDDRKLGAAIRLLRVLRADLPGDAPVEVRIDFREARKGGRLVSSEKAALGPKTSRYEHPWLEVRARLADGNDVTLRVVADVVRKEKPKRKYTKVRERTVETLDCAVRLDERYGDPGAAAERLRAAGGAPPELRVERVAAGAGRVRARFETGRHVFVSSRRSSGATGDALVTGDSILGALIWTYRGLAPGTA